MKKNSDKRRVLLVRSDAGEDTIGLRSLTFTEPLELEYLASGLDGHYVKLVDLYGGDSLEKAVKEFKPEIVGFTGYITSVKNIKRYSQFVKKHFPNAFTITGGIHATAYPEDFFNPYIDIIVTGEGINTFREIVNSYPDTDKLSEVKGLYIKESSGKYHFTGIGEPVKDPDLLPLPDRNLTLSSRKNYYYLYYKPVALVRSSLSCSYRCKFCVCHKHNRGFFATRSVDNFTDELKSLDEPNVYIIDNDFLHNEDWLREFCDACKSKEIKKRYVCFGRPDFIANNPGIIEKVSKAGLEAVITGLEFFDTRRLKGMKKAFTLDENVEALKVMRRFNIDPMASFIIPPDCGEDYFQELLNFIFENDIYHIVIQTLTPLPGTELYGEMKGKLLTGDRDLFDMSHVIVPYNIDSKKVYRGIRDVYIKTIFNFRRMRNLRLRIDLSHITPHYFTLIKGSLNYLQDLKKAEMKFQDLQIS